VVISPSSLRIVRRSSQRRSFLLWAKQLPVGRCWNLTTVPATSLAQAESRAAVCRVVLTRAPGTRCWAGVGSTSNGLCPENRAPQVHQQKLPEMRGGAGGRARPTPRAGCRGRRRRSMIFFAARLRLGRAAHRRFDRAVLIDVVGSMFGDLVVDFL